MGRRPPFLDSCARYAGQTGLRGPAVGSVSANLPHSLPQP
ncbi:hypothetical protein D556_1467 [Bordetella holmesii 41130]|nr:hypothetical protein D558_1455 [Bordetella holmesii 44057]EWM41692.1 hypothetical protein D556_1467 [Bordetella holmesii 41130]KAK75488.1 hypothetical protein L573_0088 [Bordetella holmesii H620]KAK80590.1 hypothetical protein L503_3136 [Bordetella holmesii CDC-H809-BH]KCV03677.1 hypothetical protein L501_3049 [Bordetella holmesii CDC-H719-BH]KCV11455.1 hypothetical protein AZ25_0091 [Bordetella holmesii 04P3421]